MEFDTIRYDILYCCANEDDMLCYFIAILLLFALCFGVAYIVA